MGIPSVRKCASSSAAAGSFILESTFGAGFALSSADEGAGAGDDSGDWVGLCEEVFPFSCDLLGGWLLFEFV